MEGASRCAYYNNVALRTSMMGALFRELRPGKFETAKCYGHGDLHKTGGRHDHFFLSKGNNLNSVFLCLS